MKNKAIGGIILGLVLLGVGAAMSFTSGPPRAGTALVQQCQQKMTAQGSDRSTVEQCKQVAFATAMTATDAETAARAISSANNNEIGGNSLGMFLIGLGLVSLVAGIWLQRKQRPS